MNAKYIFVFLKKFKANKGTWILASTIFNKATLIVLKIWALFYFEKAVYGQITYAISIIAFFTPFIGIGSPSGLLRFGAIAKNKREKDDIRNYTFTTGLSFSILMAIAMTPIVWFFSREDTAPYIFLFILCFRVISLFLFSYQSVEIRINDLNKRFAYYEIINSSGLLLGALLFTILFHSIGYIFSLVVMPILIFIGYCFRFGWPKWTYKPIKSIDIKAFWHYSIWASFSNVLTETVFVVDTILIGLLLNDSAVAEYNVAGLIPINILFLPIIFIKTDFSKIARNFKNKRFIKTYYSQFFVLFSIICTFGMLVAFFWGEWILSIFGKNYNPYNIFIALMIGSCISILFRTPLTQMINAFGKTRYNSISGFLTILIDVLLNLYAIPKYGLIGAAWATTFSLLFSSILSLGYFLHYLKTETN